MQSYLKYKAYYDRKANSSPLETTDYCYILNPKADTQATKKKHFVNLDGRVLTKSKKSFLIITK